MRDFQVGGAPAWAGVATTAVAMATATAKPAAATRASVTVEGCDDRFCHDPQRPARRLARTAQPYERVVLGKPIALHQDPFCALDDLPSRKRLGQRLRLVAHGLELRVAGARSLDGRQKVGLAKRLYEVPEDTGLHGARDELVLAVGGQHHDRNWPLGEDPPRRLDPVEPWHLDVEDRELRRLRLREGDRLLAVARLGADLVPRALENVAEVEADDRLVLGNEDAKARHWIVRHGFASLACHPRSPGRVR